MPQHLHLPACLMQLSDQASEKESFSPLSIDRTDEEKSVILDTVEVNSEVDDVAYNVTLQM